MLLVTLFLRGNVKLNIFYPLQCLILCTACFWRSYWCVLLVSFREKLSVLNCFQNYLKYCQIYSQKLNFFFFPAFRASTWQLIRPRLPFLRKKKKNQQTQNKKNQQTSQCLIIFHKVRQRRSRRIIQSTKNVFFHKYFTSIYHFVCISVCSI